MLTAVVSLNWPRYIIASCAGFRLLVSDICLMHEAHFHYSIQFWLRHQRPLLVWPPALCVGGPVINLPCFLLSKQTFWGDISRQVVDCFYDNFRCDGVGSRERCLYRSLKLRLKFAKMARINKSQINWLRCSQIWEGEYYTTPHKPRADCLIWATKAVWDSLQTLVSYNHRVSEN